MAEIVAVAGAKGGIGKTTLAVQLAVALAARGRRTLLVELDAQSGVEQGERQLPRPLALDERAEVGSQTFPHRVDVAPELFDLDLTRPGGGGNQVEPAREHI